MQPKLDIKPTIIKLYNSNNYLRYKLYYKTSLLNLINKVNKLIKNSTIIFQLDKIRKIYNIKLKNLKS